MNEVYLAHPESGEPVATRENVVQTLWKQGFLSEELLYWRNDLPDWVRLGDRYVQQGEPASRSLSVSVPRMNLEPDAPDTCRRGKFGRMSAAFHPRHPRRRPFREDAFEIDFDF